MNLQIRCLLLVGLFCLFDGCAVRSRPNPAPSSVSPAASDSDAGGGASAETLDAAAEAFFRGPILRFEVQVGAAEWESLRNEPRKPVPATVVVGPHRFEKVSIHVKGAAGSTRPVDENPALTLNFNRLNPGQSAFGLHKLHLNNSVQDPSRMTELVASTLYREAGIPTARATQAWVSLNGRNLGLYVVKEGYDKMFLRRNFPGGPGTPGDLYDGGFLRDIDQDLDREVGRGTNDYASLKLLRQAVEKPDAQLIEALGKVLDLERFLTFCALQSITEDWDGYARNRNNYRLYYEPVSGRFHFIPHGMDQLFGNPDQTLYPAWGGIVAHRLLELPEFQVRYLNRIRQIRSSLFTKRHLEEILDSATARLDASLVGHSESERKELHDPIDQLRSRLYRRILSLHLQDP